MSKKLTTASQRESGLRVPESLETQLHGYRRQVWALKLTEALAIAVFAVAMAYLAVFALDRLGDTPAAVRTGVFIAALVGCSVVPWYLHRWVWRRRKLTQLARLLSKRMPRVGDQLLGVIELAEDQSEQARSPKLVEAAFGQVAESASTRDFREATPPSRRRVWGTLAAGCVAGALALAALFPAAAANAWARFLGPWNATPRYTFAAVEPLPEKLIVAHGEPFRLPVTLQAESQWQPEVAAASIGRQREVTAPLAEGKYDLEMPAQIGPGEMQVDVGDARHRVQIEPTMRPQLTALNATIALPEYLGRDEPLERDARGGAISTVIGSQVALEATISRPLVSATVDGQPAEHDGAVIRSESILIEADQQREFAWVDKHGLAGVEPFQLAVTAVEDEKPTLVIEGLPRQKVMLETDLLNFKVRARDDFGVQRVGFSWRGFVQAVEKPAEGERMLAAGNPEAETLAAQGVFSAKSLGISPQPIELRVFTEDYYPERGRVYSPPHVIYILSPDQHAIWMTEQLSKWHRQAMEVRDRELQLYEGNREIRDMAAAELDTEKVRKRIEKQAAAERANGRRLRRLTAAGGELVREASRNPEIGVGHLERWAEMLSVLGDVSANRMPSVADLLKQGSKAPKVAKGAKPSKQASPPSAGMVKDTRPGTGKPPETEGEPKPPVPTVVDKESSQNQPGEMEAPEDPGKKKSSKGRFTLPVTTVAGSGKGGGKKTPAGKKVDEAVEEQKDLLAEFDKIANELNEILANLEGSTLVKRLKAASRKQYKIGSRVSEQLTDAFGMRPTAHRRPERELFEQLDQEENMSSQNVSYIMDDMQAYFERRQMMRFRFVLDEMRKTDVIGSLRRLGTDIAGKQGLSLAQCEYWSDTMDRWADDLVDPACSGCCPGGKSANSLPPSIVLEAMKILEAEVNLREETRVAEQARAAVKVQQHTQEARRLADTQDDLHLRVIDLGDRIRELDDAEQHFGKELKLLTAVAQVMDEAVDILAGPETGSPAIAVETEAIELLLRSKKLNPKGGGGGGGSSPGGGGGGDTDAPAIALVGRGVNAKEVREERPVVQTTGESGEQLPAEFRAGLDEYFSRFEQTGGE